MSYVYGVSLIMLMAYAFVYYRRLQYDGAGLSSGDISFLNIGLLSLVCLCVHVLFARSYSGFSNDINCFRGWSRMIFEDGFKNFYTSEAFTDYPPGYMYVLYVLGAISHFWRESITLLKIPAICCDILIGIIIYFTAKKKFSELNCIILSGCAMLCPTFILNSALWGQVDSIYTLFVIIFILAVTKKKYYFSYFVFALAIFIKPQALIFTPILLFAFYRDIIKSKNSTLILKHITVGIGSILMLVLLSMPFGIKNVIMQYTSTIKSYPYFTINAFNLWGALGLNWHELGGAVGILGYVFIILIVIYTGFLYFKENDNLFLIGGILSFFTYMLSLKMHDRYAFAAVALFLLAYIYRPSRYTFSVFVLSAISQFINTAFVLFVYETDTSKYAFCPEVRVFSVINICLLLYIIYTMHNSKCQTEELATPPEESVLKTATIPKMKKIDYIIMVSIATIYGIISFVRLGETVAPQTYYDLSTAPCVVDFDQETNIDKLILYLSCNDLNETREIELSLKKPDGIVIKKKLNEQAVFGWNFIDINETNIVEATLSAKDKRIMVMEAGFISKGSLVEVSSDNPMFDEQNLIPDRKTSQNSAYFDEIYHARTAYEFIHGFRPYEWTHPPLGKSIMSLGVKLFGMTPFGYRVMGNIFGILMVFVFYLTAKKMFSDTFITSLSTILFTFDFMHFVQTRIATIDVYGTFFIMLMYLLFYRYYKSSFYDTRLTKTFVPLLLTGVAFGMGAASKWTAIYACGGIAILFFSTMYQRLTECQLRPTEYKFTKKFILTDLFCCLAFIIIPILIYCGSYFQYLGTEYADGFKTIIDNQSDMFIYHSKTVLNSTHPYSSKWYTWPVMVRPIWYYSGKISETVKEGISAFGNPAVWWVGIGAIIYNGYLFIVKRDKLSFYLIVGYLSCLLPWVFVERTTYIYHYFPCVSFMVLMIGYSMKIFCARFGNKGKKACIAYVCVAIILFLMFYPVLTGLGVPVSYVDRFLRWFGTWVLI